MHPLPDPAHSIEISPLETHAALEAIRSGSIGLLDCREEDEWTFNRLPHACWIPLSRFSLPSPPDIPWIVYCHHGMRSLRAAHWLREKGLQAWSMHGGIHAWSLQVDPDVPTY